MSNFFNSIKENFNDLPTWGKVAAFAAIGASSYCLISKFVFNKPRKSPYKADYKPGVVYLYQFQRAAVIPSISPYALKLETWLRMASIDYENVPIPFWIRSREGQLPFVELNGIEYCDSSFIIRDLTKILKKESFDGSLSDEKRAVSRAFQQMVEQTTLLSYAYLRYTEHLDELLSDKIFIGIPFYWRLMMPSWKLKKQFRKNLYIHGIGRHPREEVINIGMDDLKHISVYLSSKQYFHGDTPTTIDAFLFGVLAQILYVPLDTPHQRALKSQFNNLVQYCERIKNKYWPDWEEILKTKDLNTWNKRKVLGVNIVQ